MVLLDLISGILSKISELKNKIQEFKNFSAEKAQAVEGLKQVQTELGVMEAQIDEVLNPTPAEPPVSE